MGSPHRRPPPYLTMGRVFLLRLRLLFRVSPVHRGARDSLGQRTDRQTRDRSFRGLVPLQRFPSRAEPHRSDGSRPTGYVASSGFRTLSTPCSPRDLPGLFHPGPALGVRSSRPCSARAAVRHPWRRAPPGVPTVSEETARPSRGPAQHAKPAHDAQGLARPPCRMPPRASSPPRCLASGGGWAGPPTASPHVLSRLGVHARLAAGTPGCCPPETQPLSLETGATSMEFSTSLVVSPVRTRRRAGS
jgi:hypothetical protein